MGVKRLFSWPMATWMVSPATQSLLFSGLARTAGRLPGFDAGLDAKAETGQIGIQPADLEQSSHLEEEDVAGFLQGTHHVEGTVPACAFRREADILVIMIYAVAIGSLLLGSDNPFHQSSGGHGRLMVEPQAKVPYSARLNRGFAGSFSRAE